MKSKHLKPLTKKQVMRNRKIVRTISMLFFLLGFGIILLVSGTRIECVIPWRLLLVGCVLLGVSYLGFSLLNSTKKGCNK